MPKTVPAGEIKVPGIGSFVANAVPDAFDERDLIYRPRLEPLLERLDRRPEWRREYVLRQDGQSCTGHAVATLINIVLARRGIPSAGHVAQGLVSPYMLYRLARRYDEFAGEGDAGSSLRGAFKGWFHHGAALLSDWPSLRLDEEPDLNDPAFCARCGDRPLGAFYRVNPFRLDDMQSAINELQAVCVSAVIHEGWARPVRLVKDGQDIYVIARRVDSPSRGGHAFVLVGYNDVGFLVQNSWGQRWGKGGFATLPYEDWLDCAYDAWVARPGVPHTPFVSGRRLTTVTGGDLATGTGPDLDRLARHVVNLGNNGRLSDKGRFVSTPNQIHAAFEHMDRWHACWNQAGGSADRHIVLYAHGGLVSEAGGLLTAQKHLNFWLNHRVYPLYFAWQSGPAESMVDSLSDWGRSRLPAGGLGFDLVEQFDRLFEKIARSMGRWMWDEMKENARAASGKVDASGFQWPPASPDMRKRMAAAPGATLAVSRLAAYVQAHQPHVKLHLVGHSAGSIFLAALLPRLAEAGLSVETLTLMAPAIRVDDFRRDILPFLGPGNLAPRSALFVLSDQRELDDTVGTNGVTPYQKSLLFLVSRALEKPASGEKGEVPLLGMARFLNRPQSGGTLAEILREQGGDIVIAPSASPLDARTDARHHGAFDDDTPTMTSVVRRIRPDLPPEHVEEYQPNAALREGLCDGEAPPPETPAATGQVPVVVQTEPAGSVPVSHTEKPSARQASAPRLPTGAVLETADAPVSGSPILDALERNGYATPGNG